MKNTLTKLLALALCLMLLCPAALAQESYKIGQPTMALLGDTLASGKMLTADMKLDLELDGAALGLSQEEAAQILPILDVFKHATLTYGFGLIEGGIRIAAEGELANEAASDAVAVDAAIDLTLDGLRIESSLLSGRRITAQWETLLALGGLEQTYISAFTEFKTLLKSGDFAQQLAQAIEELAAQVGPILEQAGQLAAPYGQTILDFVLTLPLEMAENLNEEGYPPTATEISITVTQKDLGDLILKLCAQLEQDAVTQQLLNMLLAQSGEDVTVEALIAALRNTAAAMTDTSMPLVFFLGMDENSMPLYLEVMIENEAIHESIFGGIYFYEDAEQGHVAEFSFGVYDAEGNAYASAYIGGSYLPNPDPNVYNTEFVIYATEGETPLIELVYTMDAVPVEGSAQPTYELTNIYSMAVQDGTESMQMMTSGQVVQGMNENGGEFLSGSSQVDMYVEGMQMNASANAEGAIEPTADGGVTGFYRISESLPYVGVKNMTIDMAIASEAYDPATSAALNTLELEKMTNDEMNALIDDVMTVLENETLPKLMEVLPQEIVMMLAAE